MKEANYSNGDHYHYTYDAVGNRLTQETLIGSVPLTNNYVYDAANRLTSVDSVAYTWDNNSNASTSSARRLLNDGTNTYGYDFANRLTSFNGTSSYTYNGMGDRLQQTVNGNTTSYTLDLNAGLTQVLNDGTNQYLYGVGRIAQVNTTTEYFMGYALGSVRQLTDAQGQVTLANAYEPYGVLAQSAGSAQTSYGFTGEFTDPSGMVYLRARYYMPGDGRFLTRDTWEGDENSPMSLNRWMYVEGNPVNFTDPTGLIKESESAEADRIVKQLRIYNVFVKVDWGMIYYQSSHMIKPGFRSIGCDWNEGEWTLWELRELRKGTVDTSRAMGGLNAFIFNFGYINVEKRLPKHPDNQANASAVALAHLIVVNSNFDDLAGRWSIVHELGHVWDRNNNQRLSSELVAFTKQFGTNWGTPVCDPGKKLPGCNEAGYIYYGVLAGGSDVNMDPEEDFANSFAAYVYPIDTQLKIQKYRALNQGIYKDYLEIISKGALSQSAKPEHSASKLKKCQIVLCLLLVTDQKTSTFGQPC